MLKQDKRFIPIIIHICDIEQPMNEHKALLNQQVKQKYGEPKSDVHLESVNFSRAGSELEWSKGWIKLFLLQNQMCGR